MHIPPSEGNFEGYSFTTIAIEKVVTSGSLQIDVNVINDNHIITLNYEFLVVNCSKSIITFPDSPVFFPGSIVGGFFCFDDQFF
jgi:hypothetical protein